MSLGKFGSTLLGIGLGVAGVYAIRKYAYPRLGTGYDPAPRRPLPLWPTADYRPAVPSYEPPPPPPRPVVFPPLTAVLFRCFEALHVASAYSITEIPDEYIEKLRAMAWNASWYAREGCLQDAATAAQSLLNGSIHLLPLAPGASIVRQALALCRDYCQAASPVFDRLVGISLVW
jgi:hypothetical protein